MLIFSGKIYIHLYDSIFLRKFNDFSIFDNTNESYILVTYCVYTYTGVKREGTFRFISCYVLQSKHNVFGTKENLFHINLNESDPFLPMKEQNFRNHEVEFF